MRKITLSTVLLLIIGSAFAQRVKLNDHQANLNLLPTTLSYEKKLGDETSFTLSAGLGYYFEFYAYSDSYGNNESRSEFLASPIVNSSFRKYYERRNVKKKLKKNSGNYIALFTSYSFKPLGDPRVTENYLKVSNSYVVGPVWGIQRNYKNSLHLGLSIGLGIQGGKYINTTAGIIGDFSLGFVIGS